MRIPEMTEDLRLKRLARNVYQAQYREKNRKRYNAYAREYYRRRKDKT